MMAIISLFTGFLSPFLGPAIGQALNYFQKKQDNLHELEMLKESNNGAREIATLNAQVGMAQAEVADVKSARESQPSYGVALLDAVKLGGWVEQNLVAPLLIFALAIIEVANGLMRPWVIYLISGMWASAKLAQFYFGYQAALGGGTATKEIVYALATAAVTAWNSEDNLYMEYVVGFLLGSRHQLKREGNK